MASGKNEDPRGHPSNGPSIDRHRFLLHSWLNKTMKCTLTDGRTVVGVFLCTDGEANIILGQTREYLGPFDPLSTEEPRTIGLAMVPGKHIVALHIDESNCESEIF